MSSVAFTKPLPVPMQTANLSTVKAMIDGQTYSVSDLTTTGIVLHNIDESYAGGKLVAMKLSFPFATFSADLHVEGDVVSYNKAERLLTCRFANLTDDQVKLVHQLHHAFTSVDAVAVNNVSKITTRDNFIRVNKTELPAALTRKSHKQYIGLTIATLLGLAALGFILANIYAGIFTVRAIDAMVAGPSFEMRSTAIGTLSNALETDATIVEKGQVLATINTTGEAVQITSPCDCAVLENKAVSGQYISSGESLFTLVPNDAKPWIAAEIDPEKMAKIGSKTAATVTIAGSEQEYRGHVTALKSGMATDSVNFNQATLQKPVQVKIVLDQKIPAEFAGRPATVLFTVR